MKKNIQKALSLTLSAILITTGSVDAPGKTAFATWSKEGMIAGTDEKWNKKTVADFLGSEAMEEGTTAGADGKWNKKAAANLLGSEAMEEGTTAGADGKWNKKTATNLLGSEEIEEITEGFEQTSISSISIQFSATEGFAKYSIQDAWSEEARQVTKLENELKTEEGYLFSCKRNETVNSIYDLGTIFYEYPEGQKAALKKITVNDHGMEVTSAYRKKQKIDQETLQIHLFTASPLLDQENEGEAFVHAEIIAENDTARFIWVQNRFDDGQTDSALYLYVKESDGGINPPDPVEESEPPAETESVAVAESPEVQESLSVEGTEDRQEGSGAEDSLEVLGSPDVEGAPEVPGSSGAEGAPEVPGSPVRESSPEVSGSSGVEGSPEAPGSPGVEGSPEVQGSPGADISSGVSGNSWIEGSSGGQVSPDVQNAPGVKDLSVTGTKEPLSIWESPDVETSSRVQESPDVNVDIEPQTLAPEWAPSPDGNLTIGWLPSPTGSPMIGGAPEAEVSPSIEWMPEPTGSLATGWLPSPTGSPMIGGAPEAEVSPSIEWIPKPTGSLATGWLPSPTGSPMTEWIPGGQKFPTTEVIPMVSENPDLIQSPNVNETSIPESVPNTENPLNSENSPVQHFPQIDQPSVIEPSFVPEQSIQPETIPDLNPNQTNHLEAGQVASEQLMQSAPNEIATSEIPISSEPEKAAKIFRTSRKWIVAAPGHSRTIKIITKTAENTSGTAIITTEYRNKKIISDVKIKNKKVKITINPHAKRGSHTIVKLMAKVWQDGTIRDKSIKINVYVRNGTEKYKPVKKKIYNRHKKSSRLTIKAVGKIQDQRNRIAERIKLKGSFAKLQGCPKFMKRKILLHVKWTKKGKNIPVVIQVGNQIIHLKATIQ